jgi:HEAT repeat protein
MNVQLGLLRPFLIMIGSQPLRALLWLMLALALPCAAQENTRSVAELVEMLGSSEKFTRREAAYQLSKIGPDAKEAVPALIKALEDPEQQVWFGAVTALSLIGPEAKEAVPALIKGLDNRGRGRRDSALQVWYRSAFALGKIGPAAIPELLEALSQPSTSVRSGAALALGFMEAQAKDAIAPLIHALGDPGEDVRQRAAEALGAIGPDALPGLQKALADSSPEVRTGAAFALHELGDAAKPASERLAELLKKEEDPKVAAQCIDALSRIGYPPKDFIPLLVDRLKTSDEAVAQASINALLLLPRPEKEAVPALIDLLENTRELEQKSRATLVLGQIGPAANAAIPSLKKAAESDVNLRAQAEAALKQVQGEKTVP